jgi:tRNA A37 threonylcarbamoyladenosine modification protein TsaB
VGLTTVKAWSEVYGRRIASVSRLEAIAAGSAGYSPYVAAFIDARRNQIFAALYRRRAAALQRVDDEMVIAPDKFLEWCTAKASLEKIDWVSTDPNCLTQTPPWSSRLALNETVQEISPVLASRIGQIGYRLALQNQHTDSLALDANYILIASLLPPSPGKYVSFAQPTRRPSPKFCTAPPRPPGGRPKATPN